MFLHKKYSPHTIDELAFHEDVFKRLVHMSKDTAIPHIILYGPDGAGKKTLSRLLLENVYDQTINNTVDAIYTINGSGNATTEISIKQSAYHVVIDPNNNNFDRYLIQDIVKEYAKRMPMDVFQVSKNFRTVLINDVDNLSYYAQMSLRRTMEKYSKTCRFLMICNAVSKLIDPLKSRCVCVRVQSPTNAEIINSLMRICYFEKHTLDIETMSRIITQADRNIKYAIWLLECSIRNMTLSNTYETTLSKIITLILEKNPKNIIEIHELLYSIFVTNISGNMIIKDIALRLCSMNITATAMNQIIKLATKYEQNITLGRREIIHLSGFINNIILVMREHSNTQCS